MATHPQPLGTADVAWLRMESPTNPMMISGVMMLGQPISRAELDQLIAERLLIFERFKHRVAGIGHAPRWELDPHFHLDNHIHELYLPPPGTQVQLEALVSDLMSTHLDFNHPPWEMHLVQNFGAGTAIIVRLHHCIADGIALVHVLLSIADEYFDPANAHTPKRPARGRSFWENIPVLKPAVKALQTTAKASSTVVNEGLEMLFNPPHLITRAKQAMSVGAALSRLALLAPDSPTLFKGALSTRKRASWSQPIPVSLVKEIGHGADAKINDVLLSAVAGALRRYLLEKAQPVSGTEIAAVVPVNLRPLEEAFKLGNYFGLVFLSLPVGIEDPQARLVEIKRRMDRNKYSSEAAVLFGVLQTAGAAPQEVQDLMLKVLSAKATGVMTNVPGPREQLHFLGRSLDRIMFWVPQAGSIGLGVSILSYNGSVLLGIATDENMAKDPAEIVRHFEAEFADMKARFVTA